MKYFTESDLRELLERAFRKGWEKAMEPIDNVPTALIGWNAKPEEFPEDINELMKDV